MKSKECLRDLISRVNNPDYFDREEMMEDLIVIKEDLDALEILKNALVIEHHPPKFEKITPDDDIQIAMRKAVTNYEIKMQYLMDEQLIYKLTQWIITNFDKKTIYEWFSKPEPHKDFDAYGQQQCEGDCGC